MYKNYQFYENLCISLQNGTNWCMTTWWLDGFDNLMTDSSSSDAWLLRSSATPRPRVSPRGDQQVSSMGNQQHFYHFVNGAHVGPPNVMFVGLWTTMVYWVMNMVVYTIWTTIIWFIGLWTPLKLLARSIIQTIVTGVTPADLAIVWGPHIVPCLTS